jgi:hypothetical protein
MGSPTATSEPCLSGNAKLVLHAKDAMVNVISDGLSDRVAQFLVVAVAAVLAAAMAILE